MFYYSYPEKIHELYQELSLPRLNGSLKLCQWHIFEQEFIVSVEICSFDTIYVLLVNIPS